MITIRLIFMRVEVIPLFQRACKANGYQILIFDHDSFRVSSFSAKGKLERIFPGIQHVVQANEIMLHIAPPPSNQSCS